MRKNSISFICIVSLLFFTAAPVAADSQPTLSDAVYADLAVNGYLDNVSVSFYDGNSQQSIGINDTKHWVPGSTVKLFAAMYAYKLISESKLNLYQSIPVDSQNVVPTELETEDLPEIQAGDYLTVGRLLKQMIIQSDNTAFNVMLDVLDRQAITDYIHSLGLIHSQVGSKLNLDTSQEQSEFDIPGFGYNSTTTEDYNKAFTLLWQNKIPGAQPLIEVLKQQRINYMIPLLLPKDIAIAHKHGDLDPLFHDGGIVFANKDPYVVSIFTNTGDPNVVAHLSELIYTKNFDLVGQKALQDKKAYGDVAQPIDPLVAEGKPVQPAVLGAQIPPLPPQPITAADLGITAADLSLSQSKINLPKVLIPADSPFHFLVPMTRFIEQSTLSTNKDKAALDVQYMLLRVAEAKDLASRGKTTEAAGIFDDVQQTMTTVTHNSAIKTDAQTQIGIQAVSQTRFQLLSDSLQATHGVNRDALIKEIGQQAKETLAQVQPNIPLATNATNPSQHVLVGQVVDKNDNSLIVKTTGGTQMTIPVNQPITIKEKNAAPQPAVFLSPTAAESETAPVGAQTSLPSTKQTKSLTDIQVGENVALVGSSTNNTFIPTFVLTHVSQQLVAPQPVLVEKVNIKNNTMVVVDNGLPVQVNISSQTLIRSQDTDISLNKIKPGDTVIVHGQPLVSVIPSPTPSITNTPIPSQHLQTTTPSPIITGLPTITIPVTSAPSVTTTTIPSISPIITRQKIGPLTITIAQPTIPVKQVITLSPPQLSKQKLPEPTVSVQPKVIQSTSVQLIEKKEDQPKLSTQQSTTQQKPAPSAPQSKPQPPAQPTAAPNPPVKTKK